jgi:hypothetical protein
MISQAEKVLGVLLVGPDLSNEAGEDENDEVEEESDGGEVGDGMEKGAEEKEGDVDKEEGE